jgi:hypothetical protein
MKMQIMLDLETLGTTPGSAILAIGAVKFGGGHIHSEFYQRVSLKSCVQYDLKMEPDTVLWWLQQPDEARLEITKEGQHLAAVLQSFSNWIYEKVESFVPFIEDVKLWGNGAAFDNVLLSVAYDRAGLTLPWKYSNDRCYRTVKNLYPDVQMECSGTHHNALDDARSQAMHLMNMLPNL